jgi:hypothetical protein
MVVKKRRVARGGKNIIFRRGGGINIVFGPKYRPLAAYICFVTPGGILEEKKPVLCCYIRCTKLLGTGIKVTCIFYGFALLITYIGGTRCWYVSS